MDNIHLIKNCATICFLTFFFFACKSDHSGKAVVTVKDTSGTTINGVTIILDCVATGPNVCADGLSQTDNTNKNGEAQFETNLPSVLKAIALYLPPGTTDSMGGKAFIEFKEGETTEQTITISPCNPCWSVLIQN